MNAETPPRTREMSEEISALIKVLEQAGARLEQLTSGEMEPVIGDNSRQFSGPRTQEQFRRRETARQAAILNALPAHIALLDSHGIIISVNEAWRRFADKNGLRDPQYGIGRNYLDICSVATGIDSSEAHQASDGIQSVLDGSAKSYSIEYPCHSPTEQRWFQLTVTPLKHEQSQGVVAMHLNITKRKAAEQQVQRHAQLYAALSECSRAIVKCTSENELFAQICRAAVQFGGMKMAWVGLIDARTQMMQPVANFGDDGGYLKGLDISVDINSPLGHGPTGTAVRGDQPSWCQNILTDPATAPWRERAVRVGVAAAAALPLHRNGMVVGTFNLYSSTVDSFDGLARGLLVDMARDISFALDNFDREEKFTRLNRIQAVSSAINALIVRVQDRQELFYETCRIAVEQGNFETAWVGVLDRSTQEVEQVAQAGRDLRPPGEQVRIDVATGQGVASRAIREKRPVFDNDLATSSRAMIGERGALAIQAGFRSRIALPFMVDGAVVGHLSLYAKEPDFFNEDEVKLLTDLAENMSFALEHIGKDERIFRLSRIQLIKSRINALIVRAGDHNELFNEACRIAVEEGGFRMAMIALADQSAIKLIPVAWAGKDKALMNSIKSILSSVENAPKTMVARAIREKTILLSNDSQKDPRVVFKKEYADSGVRSMAVFPLIVMNEAIGVLALYSNEISFFDEEETRLLTDLVSNVAFAHDFIGKRERLDYLAFYDPLTGLAKRNLFLDRVAQHMRSAAGNGRKLALFLIDLERFKNINDSLGRPAGDAILLQVAKWLTRLAGDARLVARLDADHFAAVMPEVKPGGNLPLLIEKTMAAVLMHPFRLNGEVFRIAVKVGAALFPDDGTDAEILFRNAEAALKKAKAGGDRYLFHTHNMTEAVADKLSLENQLRQAFDNDEFVLHYQPKVNLVSGRMTSVEALIRWNDPATGLVPPGRFIPILEETGLIYEVGRWAITKAIKDYLRWRNAGLPAVRIAVNVSPLQLNNLGFVGEIRKATSIHPYAAAGLELEITESLIMKDVSQNIVKLQAIRDMGVKISIDDFGTGFSSLSYLARLPVDTLKIDCSFVNDMTEGPEKLALVSTIINLAHSLNLTVVAEGVETEEQARLLRLLACDEMQGYLFSKPVPGDIFESQFLVEPAPGVAINPPGTSA